ncbi:hypothetical protein A9Q81_10170 [Gammaproteobacteria bacterium 42_54_T18]|nr:hypothetical protein A9Q81_10170 [Gammaproteobacteria bacterium 42_54_T18]
MLKRALLNIFCVSMVLPLFLWAGVASAKSFCFVKAETYYEHVYCEVSSKGNGRHLPDFYDFRKNDPLIQALLLKKPAARSGITLAMPRKKTKSVISKVKGGAKKNGQINVKRHVSQQRGQSSWRHNCEFDDNAIVCATKRYVLTGNKNNNTLKEGALSKSNRMGLAPYRQRLDNKADVNDYLVSSYQRYIEKMLAIGLGGVTMSSGKFAFLFHDLTNRGVSFDERFETMYRYLIKDKKAIRVNERASIDRPLSMDRCLYLSDNIITCAATQKNFLFVRA